MEAVISTFEPMHIPARLHRLDCLFHQLGSAERIASSVEAENRHFYKREMRVAQLVELSRRVKGIREQEQPRAVEILRSHHRRRPATHRAATDDQSLRLQLRAGLDHDCLEAFLQSRHLVGPARSLLTIEKVETDRADAAFAE